MNAITDLPLTKRQLEIYRYVRECILGGLPPTCKEIKDRFGFASSAGAKYCLDVLAKKGFVTVEPHKARCIRLTSKRLTGNESPGAP